MDIPNRASDAGPADELEQFDGDPGREYSADDDLELIDAEDDLELYDEVLGCEDFDEEL